jgi:hypothetical protein
MANEGASGATKFACRRSRYRWISRASEHGQRRFNAIIRNEQLHTGSSAFHSQAYADND